MPLPKNRHWLTRYFDMKLFVTFNNFEYLAQTVIPILKRELKWTPARERGRTVDFLQIFSISFKKGVINIKASAN